MENKEVILEENVEVVNVENTEENVEVVNVENTEERVQEFENSEAKRSTFADIFTDKIVKNKVVDSYMDLSKQFSNQLQAVTGTAISSELNEETEKRLIERYKEVSGDDLTDMTSEFCSKLSHEQLDYIFENIKFNEEVFLKNINESKDDYYEFIRSYLILFITTYKTVLQTERAMNEIELVNKTFLQEIDDLISTVDTFDYLNDLQRQIDEAETDEEKALLRQKWQDVYIANDLSFITDKLNNKPFKIIQRELKTYDNTKKKALAILKNDSANHFMDISRLEESLLIIFGDCHKEAIRLFMFLLFKRICKRRIMDDVRLLTFINIFALDVYKCLKYTDQERQASVFYNQFIKNMAELSEFIDNNK